MRLTTQEHRHVDVARSSDPYGITAHCIAVGAKWLLTREAQSTGVVDTAAAFGGREFLQALEPFGVRVARLNPSG